MLTFQDQYTLFQNITGDTSATGLVLAKRDINEGGAIFLNRLGRKFNKEYLTTPIEANQQYYQFSAGILRISEIRCLNGSNYYTPILVTSESEWNQRNVIASTSSYPTHYYIRGFNEVGLYPIPAANVTAGMIVSYEPQHVDLTQADFTTGTVTVTNGQVAVTHSASGFTAGMVGRWLQITDGSDGKWYRIGSYTSSSVVNLENYYEGASGSGRTFRIGEVMKIPNGYQDAPVYFAAERFYMTQNDQRTAPVFHTRFEARVAEAKATYARSTSRAGIKSRNSSRQPRWVDLTPPVTYP